MLWKPGCSQVPEPRILSAPWPARLKKAAVRPVAPTSQSPAATATAIGCAESKNTMSTSMPCSAKKPFSLATKFGLPPIERTTPAFTLSAARLGVATATAKLHPRITASAACIGFILVLPAVLWAERHDIAPIDNVGGVEIALHHPLRAIPCNLMQHVGDVEPRLGIHIAEALVEDFGRLAGVFGENGEQRR